MKKIIFGLCLAAGVLPSQAGLTAIKEYRGILARDSKENPCKGLTITTCAILYAEVPEDESLPIKETLYDAKGRVLSFECYYADEVPNIINEIFTSTPANATLTIIED